MPVIYDVGEAVGAILHGLEKAIHFLDLGGQISVKVPF